MFPYMERGAWEFVCPPNRIVRPANEIKGDLAEVHHVFTGQLSFVEYDIQFFQHLQWRG
jgi:hypothetical protein